MTRNTRGRSHGEQAESDHHLCGDRCHPHPHHVAASADHARRDRGRGGGGGRGRRLDPASPRAQSRDGAARSDAGSLRPLSAAHQAGHQGGDQHHDGRQPLYEGRGAGAARGHLQARGRFAQHGVDQFRAFPAAREIQEVQVRLGAPASREHARSGFPQQLPRDRVHPAHLLEQRHALRVRVLRHRPSLQPARISSSAVW